MASAVNAVCCAALAAAFWGLLGHAIARHFLPRALSLGAAPVIGWAVFSAATLPIFILIGFSPIIVVGTGAVCAAIGGGSLLMRPALSGDSPAPVAAAWVYIAAGILALAPAAAILPKFSADGVHLADPIFDHSKIAIIDAMMRQGVPPVDPVFGGFGSAGRLAYYYLWHFSAAELALPLGASGWEADIGLTWFTAFASLTLMMGIAVWLSKRSAAAVWVVVLATAGSLWSTLWRIASADDLMPFMLPPVGLAGWLFQSTWAPQHLMSAACVITAMLVVVQYARRQSLALLVILALVVAAGFESSTYVGGVTFAIAALVSAPILLAAIEPGRRPRFTIGLAVAAVLAAALAAPFIRDQIAAVAARGGGPPIVIGHFEILGDMFPPLLRRLLDLPAYWLLLLPIEFPATFVAGSIALAVVLRGAKPGPEKTATAVLAALTGVGLCASWLLVSTLGDNNDLGLRAVLPATMVLIVATAVGMMLASRRTAILAVALGGLILGLPGAASTIRSNIGGSPVPDGNVFAQSPDLWAAVRRHASPGARVANNPLFLEDLTPWPANLSWALLGHRNSCFAGRELVLALAPLPPDRREAINAQFVRVCAGQGSAQDVSDLARRNGCDVAVIVPQDGAWTNDPFASSPEYRLAEFSDGRWRIYVKNPAQR
jgi:hypothetical protein